MFIILKKDVFKIHFFVKISTNALSIQHVRLLPRVQIQLAATIARVRVDTLTTRLLIYAAMLVLVISILIIVNSCAQTLDQEILHVAATTATIW